MLQQSMHKISATELKQLLTRYKDVIVVDVRQDNYAEQHLPGAINIPATAIEERATELPKEQLIVVYGEGQHTMEAAHAAETLDRLGFGRIMEFDGGMEEWSNKHYPIEAS
jgi:rhodanese-related sulfurtransferase